MLFYPDHKQRRIQRAKQAALTVLMLALFAGIGVLLAWRG